MSDHGTDISASDLLALEQVGDSLFRSTKNLHNLTGPIFGGQLLGQAVHACRLTVEQWPVHSCAGFFLSRTIVEEPLDFAVEVTRTGKRFASRRVLASQKGLPVFDMICSFHDPEEGLEHQREQMDVLPQPEELVSAREFVAANQDRFHEPMRTLHTIPFRSNCARSTPKRSSSVEPTGVRAISGSGCRLPMPSATRATIRACSPSCPTIGWPAQQVRRIAPPVK